MEHSGVLVRFGEIGIKSPPVRRMMQKRLRDNLLAGLLRDGVEGDVTLRGPRVWMVGPDTDALADVAIRTFGVVSATPCVETDATIQAMSEVAAALASQEEWTRFAVRPRRQGQHGFSSQDIGIQVGSAVFRAAEAAGRSPKVDLSDPELEVFVEVRDRRAFIGTRSLGGPGGIPMGSQGRVVVLLSDTHSAVAAWLMMRRGCAVVPLHAGDMGSAPLELTEPLQRWGLGDEVEVLPVCSGATTKQALQDAACDVARDLGAAAIVTGDTLHSALLGAPLPVLRPVCGLAPGDVEDLIARIGLPDETGPGVLGDGGEGAASLLRLRQTVSV